MSFQMILLIYFGLNTIILLLFKILTYFIDKISDEEVKDFKEDFDYFKFNYAKNDQSQIKIDIIVFLFGIILLPLSHIKK